MKHAIRCSAAVIGAVIFIALDGCASLDASNQKSLLSASGFRARTPETARQKELYAAVPSYKVQRLSVKGKVYYVYKHEKEGVAYVGGETEYQRYQQLALEQRIAQEQSMAAEMQREMALGWYGAWGPRFDW
jgi:hypothetical protein